MTTNIMRMLCIAALLAALVSCGKKQPAKDVTKPTASTAEGTTPAADASKKPTKEDKSSASSKGDGSTKADG